MKTKFRLVMSTFNNRFWCRKNRVHLERLCKYIDRTFMTLVDDLAVHNSWNTTSLESVYCNAKLKQIHLVFVIEITNKVEFNKKKLSRPSLQEDMEYLDNLSVGRIDTSYLVDITNKVEALYHKKQKVYG